METTTGPVFCFGKVPGHGDFVRHGAGGTGLQEMDAWFQKGLFAARERVRDGFDDAYDAAPAYAFVFAPADEGRTLIGVVQTSRDRSGRRYPFLVAFEADPARLEVRRMAGIPVRFRPFFEWAAPLIGEATAGRIEIRTLFERLDEFNELSRAASARTPTYEEYLRETTCKTLVEQLWGQFADARKFVVMKNLIDVTGPIKNGVPDRFRLGLRFPLPADGSLRDHTAGFWLDLCLRLLRFPQVQPTFFWTAPRAKADRPVLLLYLRPPAAQAFQDLLPVDLERERLCVLDNTTAAAASQAGLSIPPPYAALLESEQASLWDVLDRL